MKVAIVYDLTEAGGVQTCVFSLIKGLNSKNIIPVVFWDKSPNKSLVEELQLKIDFSIMKFNVSSSFVKKTPNLIRFLLWPFNMVRISEIPDTFDFVYSFTPNILVDIKRPHLFYLSGPPLLPQLESKNLRFKIAKQIYKVFIEPFHPAYLPQDNANYVINSEYTSKMFEDAHGRRLQVVYPSNQLDFDIIKDDSKERIYSTFFSRIVDYKRPDFIIQLAKEFPDQKFVIMGGVSKNRVKYFDSLITASKHLNNIQFYPNATKQDVETILSKTKYYIFPAINEHFGITTVEAILKGCIPYVHDSGGQREIVPISQLRFNDDQFISKYKNIVNISVEEQDNVMNELFKHINQFTEETYINKMLHYIQQ